ncbi:MAG: hydrogenase formation protein HypD [Sulfurovum sp.]|nr:hydrogenase formation protein HypD [Sulfurovum sp.]
MSSLSLRELYEGFRDPRTIRALVKKIEIEADKLGRDIHIMEVCGGHTHSIVKHGLHQLMPQNIHFIHGPGCPVCVLPKERIDHAYRLAMQSDVILVTLGDMIKVPGSKGSLQDARAQGADVRYVYSPLDTLRIAKENPDKKVIFFAIGFETTTPMTAALVGHVINEKIDNIFFHINHITVPEPMKVLLDAKRSKIDAFIGPSHVSVISGAKIYKVFPEAYHTPVVVCGFEPVDILEGILMLLKQRNDNRCEVEIEYTRSVTPEGNLVAQKLIDTFFEKRNHFRWRGIGDIAQSALQLREEFAYLDAEKIYSDLLPNHQIDDHKQCICGEILMGAANPCECKLFGNACTPSSPLGSCMVSSEGACAAYYRYGNMR